MSVVALPRSWPCARPAASAGTAPPVAMVPLACSVLGSACASTKQAVPTAWPGCPRVLPALASRSHCPQAARCLQKGDFPALMRLGRLGLSSLSALIKVLAVLPGRVGG